jgi:hypothetical protein
VVLSGYLSLHQLKMFLADVRAFGYRSELLSAPAKGCDVLVQHESEAALHGAESETGHAAGSPD